MKDIAVVNLHVGDLEISDAVNHNVSGIGLLTTRFGIKARAVKNQAEGSIPGNVRRRLDKRLLVKNRLDISGDISKALIIPLEGRGRPSVAAITY